MSTFTTQTEAAGTTTNTRTKLWPTAVGFGLIAAAATTLVAAVADASGISLDVADEPIVLFAFPQLTFMFTMVGLAIAVGVRRWASNARRTWIRTTAVLTALSLVPDALADADVSTRLVLMLTHLVAASIVIPAVARRLDRG